MIRQHEMLYTYLHKYPRHVLVPHRLVPYPEEVLTEVHNRNLSTSQIMDWTDMNCCLPLQNCQERKSWILITNASVPIVNIFGLQVGLGNLNFHEESFRACHLTVDGNALQPCHGTFLP